MLRIFIIGAVVYIVVFGGLLLYMVWSAEDDPNDEDK